jgi:hypothetical protein
MGRIMQDVHTWKINACLEMRAYKFVFSCACHACVLVHAYGTIVCVCVCVSVSLVHVCM